MSHDFGSKRLVVGAHYGLRDFLVQRASAALMVAFTLLLLLQVLLTNGPIDYAAWAGIFAKPWMKGLSFATLIALAWHAWVGVRDIWMDYVKPAGIRLVLHVLTIIWLAACLGAAIQALWRL